MLLRARPRDCVAVFAGGMYVLVPGILGYRGLSLLFGSDVLVGVETIVSTSIKAIAIVAGLLVADLLTADNRARVATPAVPGSPPPPAPGSSSRPAP